MKYPILFFVIVFTNQFTFAQPVPTTLNDFFMPGSQPLDSGDLSGPASCNCHDFTNGYIYQHWQGSMMAHALVDPLFLATMDIAQQDAAFSGDLCLRCHTPTGWLSGRSTPTDGSSLISEDETSVNCLFCHLSVHPTSIGVNPYPDDTYYSDNTYNIDQTYLESITAIPGASANGMFVVHDNPNARRGPFSDTSPNSHTALYSPFHLNAALCGTCHDVSNPVFDRQQDGTYALNDFDSPAPDPDEPYAMFPVERTYSEWKNSLYNTPSGISGTVFGGIKSSVSTCQDCHMAKVNSSITKNNTAREIGTHDMTGGNTFIPSFLTSMSSVSSESITRATFMLENATTLEVSAVYKTINVRIYNETGHKLPSGYPEGRRIWLNVQAYDDQSTMFFESGAYDLATAVLNKYDSNGGDTKIYEIKPGIGENIASTVGLPSGPSFHFVLNNTIFKDNRIPPRGFTNVNYESIQSPPVAYSYNDGQYWDDTEYTLSEMPDHITVTLYYQTTSKEYIEFLRDENDDQSASSNGQIMYNAWLNNGMSAPVEMNQVILNNNDISLAVFLSNFNIELSNGYPKLSWRTNSEIENLGFVVERSEDNDYAFQKIASYKTTESLQGLGNSNTGQTYMFMDRDTSLIAGKIYYYRLFDVDLNGQRTEHGPVVIKYSADNTQANTFVLKGNYPNPFNNGTTINFKVPERQTVAIRIYNTKGQLIREFPEYLYNAGLNKIFWDSRDNYGQLVSSGLYIYHVSSRNYQGQQKMLLLK